VKGIICGGKISYRTGLIAIPFVQYYMIKVITIEGNNFSTIDTFYNEVEKKFSQNLSFKIGRNLDAFNDVLRGGFGIHEYHEPIEIIWHNSDKSRKELGYNQTISYLQAKLDTCHPTAIPEIKKQLESAQNNEGKTFFDIILEIIRDNKHVKLILK